LKPVNVGIIGFGTVGAGTVELLLANKEIITNRTGTDIIIKKIADLDIESDRGVSVDRSLMTTNAMDVINDPDIDVIVELIGGLTKAREVVTGALKNKKHVVTANKALLAEYGKELYETAFNNGVSLSFEASVCGAVPIIGALKNGLAPNRISVIKGILNGTSNYILTRMTKEGLTYDQVVQKAVEMGFAEDPPTLDVNGTDAVHKLTILISLLLGYPVALQSIYREGIVNLTPDDIRFADEFGYRVKLLAVARQRDNGIEARVHPAMIPKDSILARVDDEFNAIYLEGDFVGPSLFYGLGAGRRPTASAVVSDIMGIARAMRLGYRGFMPPLSHFSLQKEVAIHSMKDLHSAYYFRFSAFDSPGVLSMIAGILGEHDISISSVIQKGREQNSSVPIVMLTHEAREKNVIEAVSKINRLDIVSGPTVMVRVEED